MQGAGELQWRVLVSRGVSTKVRCQILGLDGRGICPTRKSSRIDFEIRGAGDAPRFNPRKSPNYTMTLNLSKIFSSQGDECGSIETVCPGEGGGASGDDTGAKRKPCLNCGVTLTTPYQVHASPRPDLAFHLDQEARWMHPRDESCSTRGEVFRAN